MSQLYLRPFYSNNRVKPVAIQYRSVSKSKHKNFYVRAFIASFLIHCCFILMVVTMPMPTTRRNVTVTLEQWQQPSSLLLQVENEPVTVKSKEQSIEPEKWQSLAGTRSSVGLEATTAGLPSVLEVSEVDQVEMLSTTRPSTEPLVSVVDTKVTEKVVLPATVPSTDITGEWGFLVDEQNGVADAGKALLQLGGGVRHFVTMPNFDFLELNGYKARIKSVKVELKIAADGTILTSRIIPPGTGEPALDRELRNVFKSSFLNDITIMGRSTEEVVLTINFKE